MSPQEAADLPPEEQIETHIATAAALLAIHDQGWQQLVERAERERDEARAACRAVLETYDAWYPDDIFVAYPGCETGVNDILRNRQLLRAALSATPPREDTP